MVYKKVIPLLLIITGCTQLSYFDINYSVQGNTVLINTTSNATITINQTSTEFLYNIGDFWDDPYLDSGTNTYGIYLDWEWRLLEPIDDEFDWSPLNNMDINSEGYFTQTVDHLILRLGFMATSAWIHGTWGTKEDAGYPEWINPENLTLVEEEYLEFVEALLNHLEFRPEYYLLEVELNALAGNAGITNTQAIEWLEKLVNKIKDLDPDAQIIIDVAAQDLSPFMEEGRQPVLIEQDLYPLRVNEWLERLEQINYEVIGYHMQPFGWMSEGNWTNARDAIENLSVYNKSVYVTWAAFLSEEPVMNQEVEAFEYYPVNYSEEWQRDNTLLLMKYLLSNPQVIGVQWDYADFIEPDVGGLPDNPVKLATGFTKSYREVNELIIGDKKLVYEPMKSLWFEQLFNTTQSTGDGFLDFELTTGTYQITVTKGLITKTITITV